MQDDQKPDNGLLFDTACKGTVTLLAAAGVVLSVSRQRWDMAAYATGWTMHLLGHTLNDFWKWQEQKNALRSTASEAALAHQKNQKNLADTHRVALAAFYGAYLPALFANDMTTSAICAVCSYTCLVAIQYHDREAKRPPPRKPFQDIKCDAS